MKNKQQPTDRTALLADISEMYFIEGKNQNEIAKRVGMTRSNVSRLLKEARQSGIVEIQVNHPLKENNSLHREMVDRFNLIDAHIIQVDQASQLLPKLGKVAAQVLMEYLDTGVVLGTTWGTAISATVDQLEITKKIPEIKVVQLIGALGSRIEGYDGHSIVRRLEELLDAEGIYMNAPFFVDDANTAELLLETASIKENINLAKQADIALLGVGSLDLSQCSFYLAGYVPKQEILEIQKTGAIGDVCGRFFNINGELTAMAYQNQLIGITIDDLKKIPVRIGVAGGEAKVDPIIGALRGNLVNILITDTETALEVLKRTT